MAKPKSKDDFLTHLEKYLSKRDGVDKLLKLTRYTSKLIIATSPSQSNPLLLTRLKSFESSLGTTRKAFRLGKFVQDVNALRATNSSHNDTLTFILSIICYGGEGVYYFFEQFVWLAKAGLIDKTNLPLLQKLSAWFEFVGYFGSVGLKVREINRMVEMERSLVSSIELAGLRGEECGEVVERLRGVREKKVLKRVSVVQDLADGVMAFADVRDGKGVFTGQGLLACMGLVSGVISTHKNWVSC